MACPDKRADDRIVAQYENRKAMRAQPEPTTHQVLYDGRLADFVSQTDEKTIVSIHPANPGWCIEIKGNPAG